MLAGVTSLQESGPAANRLDIAIIGDGYTSQQESEFVAHADSLFGHLLDEQPFDLYRNFLNVRSVSVVSAEEGADEPGNQIFRDTALGALYDCGEPRILCVDNAATKAALDAALDEALGTLDMSFVSVNSSRYGGSGGSYAVYSADHADADEIAVHEMAHVLSRLGDEYGGPGSYDGLEPYQVNLTKSSTGQRWQQWLGFDQPDIGVIGAYEGGHGFDGGIYRPSLNSKMRSLGRPFDVVSREQLILSIYSFVDPIDNWHDNSETVVDADPTLWVDVVDPAVQSIEWYVDQQLVIGATDESFRLQDHGFGDGAYDVRARVSDSTGWVRVADDSIEQSIEWQVLVTSTPALQLIVPVDAIGEQDGVKATTATIRRINVDLGNSLVVDLASSDQNAAVLPSSATFAVGQAEVQVDIDAIDDQFLDGTQEATISVAADGFLSVDDQLHVLDHEQLSVGLDAGHISEFNGQTTVTVTRGNVDIEQSLIVRLVVQEEGQSPVASSGDLPELAVPSIITLAANQPSVSFVANSNDDILLDGDQTVHVVAAAAGYVDGTQSIVVEDHERLFLTLEEGDIYENAGQVTATVRRENFDVQAPQTVLLQSNDSSEITVPASVTIPAAAAEVSFPVTIVDDHFVDGTQSVQLTAAAGGYVGDDVAIDVLDFENLTLEFDVGAIHEHDGVAVATLTRTDGSLSQALTLTLESGDTSELVVPGSVTIPAGQDSITFAVTAVDDPLLDGTQNVRISATSATHNADNWLDVLDFEMVGLALGVASVAENDGAAAATLTVSLPGPVRPSPVTVTLGSSDTSELQVPASVTIPAGQSSVQVELTAIDDDLLDGDQPVNIVAATAEYLDGQQTIVVEDHERLFVTFDVASVFEDAGSGQVTGTVRRENIDTQLPQTVLLSSDDSSEVAVPVSVTIPADASQITFPVTIVDDDLVDGTQVVEVTATADSYVSDAATLDVIDRDNLSLTFDVTAIDENGGTAVATLTRHDGALDALTLTLESGDTSELVVPTDVTIPAGQPSVTFPVTAVDDQLLDGTQTVRISAASATHNAENSLDVLDFEMIELSLDVATVAENQGAAVSVLTVTLPGSVLPSPVEVSLSSADTSELTLPSSVTIPAGQSSSQVDLTAIDDDLLDGNQSVEITASASGYVDGQQTIVIEDHETLLLTIDVTDVFENAGANQVTGTVRRENVDTAGPQTVFLSSDDSSEVTVPVSVTIPAAASEITFPVTIVDDDVVDGTQSVQIMASADGYVADSSSLNVLDFEMIGLSLNVSEVAESAGVGAAVLTVGLPGVPLGQNVEVALASSDPSELLVADSVVIPAGQTSVQIPLDAVDDVLFDGDQTARLTATLNGYEDGQVDIDVLEHETWQNPFQVEDVNGDGSVSPVDALLVINGLNTDGPRILPPVDPQRAAFLDSSGDGALSPIDALLVINLLNEGSSPEGERQPDGPLAKLHWAWGIVPPWWPGVSESDSESESAGVELRLVVGTVLRD